MKTNLFRLFNFLVYAGGLAFFFLYAAPTWGLIWAMLSLLIFVAISTAVLGFLQFKLRIAPAVT